MPQEEFVLPKFEDLPRYLTSREAAKLLRLTMPAFYKKVHLRQIPVTKLGGSIRVDKFKIEKLLDGPTEGGNTNGS